MNFPITGFSGFYIHTNLLGAPLAVNEPTDISAINVGAKNKVEMVSRNTKMQVMYSPWSAAQQAAILLLSLSCRAKVPHQYMHTGMCSLYRASTITG